MNELSGDKIGSLLWQAGFDYIISEHEEEIYTLTVSLGDCAVEVSDVCYIDDGVWIIDPIMGVTQLRCHGVVEMTDTTIPETEEDLVRIIINLADFSEKL